MSRNRFRVLLLLLVLILLLSSFVFGILTYWLEAENSPSSMPSESGLGRAHPLRLATPLVPYGKPI